VISCDTILDGSTLQNMADVHRTTDASVTMLLHPLSAEELSGLLKPTLLLLDRDKDRVLDADLFVLLMVVRLLSSTVFSHFESKDRREDGHDRSRFQDHPRRKQIFR